MSSFESFLEDVAKKASELLGCRVITDVTRRNNGILTKGVRLETTDSNLYPRIDLESFYSDFRNGEDFDAIVQQVCQILTEASLGVDLPDFQSWESMKCRVVVMLINHERNTDLLSEVPFQDFWGLALICKIYVNNNQTPDDQMMTVTVHNVLFETWGISKDELFRQAIENSKVLLPVTMYSMYEFLAKLIPEYKESFKDVFKVPMYLMSNARGLNGASAVVYGQEKLAELAEHLGCNLWILPSSIHEVIVIPDLGASMEELTDMVKSVNKTALLEQDILSDTVYLFRR